MHQSKNVPKVSGLSEVDATDASEITDIDGIAENFVEVSTEEIAEVPANNFIIGTNNRAPSPTKVMPVIGIHRRSHACIWEFGETGGAATDEELAVIGLS